MSLRSAEAVAIVEQGCWGSALTQPMIEALTLATLRDHECLTHSRSVIFNGDNHYRGGCMVRISHITLRALERRGLFTLRRVLGCDEARLTTLGREVAQVLAERCGSWQRSDHGGDLRFVPVGGAPTDALLKLIDAVCDTDASPEFNEQVAIGCGEELAAALLALSPAAPDADRRVRLMWDGGVLFVTVHVDGADCLEVYDGSRCDHVGCYKHKGCSLPLLRRTWAELGGAS